MNNKKLKDLIEQLKEVSEELRSAETLGAEEKDEEKKAVIEAAKVCAEVAKVSSNPQETEKVNLAAQTDENISTFAVYSPTEEMHCYKDFELPDNITVKSDILNKTNAFVIDIFSGSNTITGLRPMLVYSPKNMNMWLGYKFRLNICETYGVNVYTDSLGERYSLRDNYVAGMKYTPSAPNFAVSMLHALGKDTVKNNCTAWLNNGEVAKGFNKFGELVFVCNVDGRYMEITFNSSNKITQISEGNKNMPNARTEYSIAYNSSGYISEIKNKKSEKTVTFEFSDNNLSKCTCSDGKTMTFNYSLKNMTINSSDGFIHKMTSSDTKVNVTTQSTLSKVPSGTTVTNTAMLSWEITYGDTVKVKVQNGNCEYYKFTKDGNNVMLSEYYRENYSVVTYAEKRTYTFNANNNKYTLKTFFAPKSLLYDKPYSSFVYNERYDDEYTECTYDEYNRPQYENQKNHLVDSDGTYDSFINYYKTNTYNDNGLLTKESTDYRLYSILLNEGETEEGGSCTQVTEYEYYTDNRLKKRTSYYTDRVTTKGKDIEEYVYTNDGSTYKTTVLEYNSLDITKVIVKETVYDAYGNILSETDSTGLDKFTYGWDSNGRLSYEMFPDGGKTEYGYDTGNNLANVKAFTENNVENKNEISYAKGEVTSLSSSHDNFGFTYDGERRLSKVAKDNTELYNINYSSDSERITVKITNAKGEEFKCEEDKARTWNSLLYLGNTEVYTTYKNHHLVKTQQDYVSDQKVNYIYNKAENLESYSLVTGLNEQTYSANFEYGSFGELMRVYQGGKTTFACEYAYDELYGGRLLSVKAGDISVGLNYDVLGKYTGRKVYCAQTRKDVLTESIEYKSEYARITTSNGSRYAYKQSALPSKISYSDGDWYSYSYDANGNITLIKKSGTNGITYKYDKLNRLTYEYNPLLKETCYYTYDNNGNITSVKIESSLYEDTHQMNYAYSNGRLTYDGIYSITYDALGNPTNYRGKELTWEKGKRLKKFGETTFEYDGRGRRTKKNAVRYYYDYADRLIASSDGMEYFYDHIGVAGFRYSGEYYVYKRDIQNNITGILDSNGIEVVEYDYNAWGRHKVSGSKANTIGALNPFRYRSYFYDTETKLYYLKSRYYDPHIGRFLNMDSVSCAEPTAINGLNLYAYCGNNPVMNVDPNGNIALSVLLFSIVLGGVIGGVVSGVEAKNRGLSIEKIFLAALGGAILGAAVSAAFGFGGVAAMGLAIGDKVIKISGLALFAAAAYGTALASAVDYQLSSIAYNTPTSANGYFASLLKGFMFGIISFGFGAFAGIRGFFKHSSKTIFNYNKVIETASRGVLFNLPSTVIRYGLEKLIEINWGI